MKHLYSALLCIVVHPKRFTIIWGGLFSTTTSVQHPLVFKAVHGMAPAYVSELITFRQSSRSLRSTNKLFLTVPQTHLNLKGDQAFAAAGPRLWNSLPSEIRAITSINVFKTGVKKKNIVISVQGVGLVFVFFLFVCFFIVCALCIVCTCMLIVQHFGLQVQL